MHILSDRRQNPESSNLRASTPSADQNGLLWHRRGRNKRVDLVLFVSAILMPPVHAVAADTDAAAVAQLLAGDFRWTTAGPVIRPEAGRDDPCHAIKDPTVVRYDGRWHVFATIRSRQRTHQIEYLNFSDWSEADKAQRHILAISDGYFCAPQVFYFTPHKKWYLVYQANDPNRPVQLQPACSTTETLDDPQSWTPPRLLFDEHPTGVQAWIDFWVICDERAAHLDKFPGGWSAPQVVLQGDIFEASHTYRLRGLDKYLTLVEAQNGGRRYYKAFLADRLDGVWQPLAATRDKPFASPSNVRDAAEHWTDSFSHGELLRAGHDEKLEVDPARLEFLYQGVTDADMAGKAYGEIPWNLGLLVPAK
jgi:hypothetical protein